MANPKIENRIGIQAPADVVWELLFDLDGWAGWNPLYPKAAGKIGYDSQLTLTLALPGQPQREIKPVVVEWVPHEQIHWKDRLTGWVTSTRYFEIDKLTDTACVFSNGEQFEGILAARAVRPIGRAMYEGFELLGETVKAKAEEIWRERNAS